MTPSHPSYARHEPHLIMTLPLPGVALVTINRPGKLNAFAEPSWHALGACFAQLSRDADVRAVVLAGAGGRAFSAGLDVDRAVAERAAAVGESRDVARRAKGLRWHVLDFQDAVGQIEKCEKPVVCVLHGIAYGLAIDIATTADIRICAADTRFSIKEVDIGLAADVGTLARLPRAVGSASWVRDVCLTAREFDAREALAVGLVSRVCDTKDQALQAGLDVAAVLAAKSPVAVQGTKEVLVRAQDQTVAENLRYAAMWNQAMLQSEDVHNALTSAMSKKKPTFAKL